ncbi:MAG: 3-phosphoshikimate 1-carboxyvinyltransferase [Verrucomicrobiae bacterium]|nr:3-phosphoshikimate 1-carboxyvinyltransferase [Verrucomicrobiae bacterium]
MSRTIHVRKADFIEGTLTVPGDKSVSHRAAILLGLAGGGQTAEVRNFLHSEDCLNTVKAMQGLGVSIQRPDLTTLHIEGAGDRLIEPRKVIDCGNSGTAMRLLAGVLAGQGFKSQLTGDASLCSRPMGRVMKPLTQMGAKLVSDKGNDCAPLTIHGTPLKAIHYESPVASAQIKSCILLAGLYAGGVTSLTEPVQSRDHTERMFRYLELPLVVEGLKYSIRPGVLPKSKNIMVPGDISSAAFWLVAAGAKPGASLRIEHLGLNPTRTGILNVLIRMGAKITEKLGADTGHEPMGSVEVDGAALKGVTIEGKEIPNVIDELPILAVAGALAHEGVTVIKDARELRVKETDRIAVMAANLRAVGVEVEDYEDGMAIRAGAKLRGAKVKSHGDHRIAMAMAVAGLFCEGEMIVEDCDCIDTSYPGFEADMNKIVIRK